jgi:Nucleotidyltransferase/DNA polymerase involved in DNA repair
MDKTIIHVDMDAFFAAVEVRDNPELAGKPLIIGALPHERGVVSTCSYEARKFGVRSAMSIKEAYRRCPDGIYMHPNMAKYKEASEHVHEIWSTYTDLVEYISLDEGFLDVTGTAAHFGGAHRVGQEIKQLTVERVGLTCSVGVGYSMMSAKLASEEKKPDGYFEILTPDALKELITDRSVRIILGIGEKTAETLNKAGIVTVRDIYANRQTVLNLLGNHGGKILALADGIDNREVTPYTEPKSIGKEHTFQQDITDFNYLEDSLLLTAKDLSYEIHQMGVYCCTVALKVTYSNMQQITRSKTGDAISRTDEIFSIAKSLLQTIEKRSIRLVGISLSGLTKAKVQQMSFLDTAGDEHREKLDAVAFKLRQRYGKNAIKTGNEMIAEKRVKGED